MYLNINHQPLVAKTIDQHKTINLKVYGFVAEMRPHYCQVLSHHCIKIAENKKTQQQPISRCKKHL